MTKLTIGLKQLASAGFQQVKSLTSCYNGLTRGFDKSYRHTRLGCKKLHRKMRAMSKLLERNKEMAAAELKRREDAALQQQKDHQSEMKWLFLAFLMMITEEQRRGLAHDYMIASRPESLVI